ncbi:VCBS repeat-containing protein [Methylococcus sp. EFPC2]|uniref:FG-GAP repeat domain-containing protein n=1 Tax=Methylococcus sp. EFPC2 TaxID=2812648 RepID=UPI001966DC0A|nr:VCBS repeat-containing protein [Methylococcus sp. EFPC2]QSA95631.1 VCBS repeat-containing protein [Methylococcus sp. EFPC2]
MTKTFTAPGAYRYTLKMRTDNGNPKTIATTVIEVKEAESPPEPTAQRVCPQDPAPQVVEIREADPRVDKPHHDLMLQKLVDNVGIANRTIVLGPNVELDFTGASPDQLPLNFGPCVTLTSAQAFDTGTSAASTASPDTLPPPARTPRSLGPLLKFGPHRSDDEKVFLSVDCPAPDPQLPPGPTNDNVRISGFRLYGPRFGQQYDYDIGILVHRCLNVEISNMEIAGWGGQGIQILDEGDAEHQPAEGPGQQPPNNGPGERIGHPEQVRVFHNYIHHNQHPRMLSNSHTAGYGVEVHHGAWARVYENLFDFNRHAIAAAGDTGGYEALRNLVLKGGGDHWPYFGIHTHQFDIHGTGDNGFGGRAGVRFEYANNAFQYQAGNAIKIRGRPQEAVNIHDNVFPHEGLENDWGDDAIAVENRSDLDVIHLGPNNTINNDSYGNYGVCDFDGDGIDDLFLATGQTWWFSSYGEFPWSYLSARTERLNQVRLGYFDADNRCDVLTESNGEWVIASGGTGPWQSIGAFGAPLSEVTFGRFDPSVRDHRPGATRRTTHAFRRMPSGQWQVTSLSAPAWQNIQSSSFPMSKLRFGDFTGDGVTDVLALQNGRWSISQSGQGRWQRLNPSLADDVSSLYVADLNNNNIDDLIKLERKVGYLGKDTVKETFTWWVSDDGRTRWRKLKSYTFQRSTRASLPPVFAFAGRFGAAPGGGVLLTDHGRIGRFYSEAEITRGASPDWSSPFAY